MVFFLFVVQSQRSNAVGNLLKHLGCMCNLDAELFCDSQVISPILGLSHGRIHASAFVDSPSFKRVRIRILVTCFLFAT